MAASPTKSYEDWFSGAPGGQNAGVAPLLLDKTQCAFALNVSLRGGYLHTRPAIILKTLNYQGNSVLQAIVENGLFQGAGYYRPDFGTELLLAQIAGHLIQFTEVGSNWIVTDVSVPGDINDPAGTQVWMWQSEKWMIVNDGSGKLPIFFDGTSSRRSFGDSVQVGNIVVDFTPPPIGQTVTVTLDAPFTGQYNTPLIINGAFYQAIQNNSTTPVYQSILTNLNDVAGNDETVGTQVIQNPSIVGFGIGQYFFQLGLANGTIVTSIALPVAYSGAIGAYVTWFLPGQAWQVIGTSFGNNVLHPNSPTITLKYVGVTQAGFIIPDGTLIKFAASTAPSTVIGTLTDDFIAPAVGSNVTVSLTNLYVGAAGKLVTVNGKLYTIAPVPNASATSILTLVNLTDTTNSPEPQYPTTVPEPQQILTVPELPAGRMGSYGMGRNWMCLVDGISYIAGDIVGGASGTQAYQNRDSVLKMTENTFLAGGGTFRLPGAGDQITAMEFPPILDKSLGQGELQVSTGVFCFSNNSPVDRTVWEDTTSPLQTLSLKDNGPLAQNSTVLINSDMFFRSYVGWASLIQARRDFNNEWGNKGISNEMQRPMQQDNKSLLPFGSAESFDNRFLGTCGPNTLGAGTFHTGITSLNLDLISSLRGSIPPAWEGTWTGINALQVLAGRVNGSNRAFAFTYNINTTKIELYEQLSESAANQAQIYKDNDSTSILWLFETPVLFNKDIKSQTDLCELIDGQIYLSNITDTVNVKVYYRPDFYPCWTLWHEFDVCADDDNSTGDGNKQPGYRMRIGLGSPSVKDCEPGNNRPLRIGYFHQFRIEFTGYCIFKGLFVRANSSQVPVFAPVECDTEPCQLIDCMIPDDLQIYSLQGYIPTPLPQPVPLATHFKNATIYFNNVCGSGDTLSFTGSVPGWITLDIPGNRFVGAAGTFGGQTQALADSTAQSSLNQFVTFNLANGTVVCTTPPPPLGDPQLLWYKFTEGTGTTTHDYSAAGNNGAGIFGPVVTWSTGPTGNGAILINGLSGVHSNSGSSWAATDWTYSLWINPTSTPSSGNFYDLLMTFVTSPFGPSMNLFIDETNALAFANNLNAYAAQAGSVTPSVWQMVTLTYDISTFLMTFYINGISAGTVSMVDSLDDGTPIYVGGFGSVNNTFEGKMADVRIYNECLSPADVLAVYNAGAQ